MSAKPGSQVVGESALGKSVFKIFLISDLLKTIWKPIYFMISKT